MADKNGLMRQLPKVDEIIRIIKDQSDTDAPDMVVKMVVQKEIERIRQAILSEQSDQFSKQDLIGRIRTEIKRNDQCHLRRVINATGIILHTNLGRAKLSPAISGDLQSISSGYTNLEYHLESGERGSRYEHVERLLTFLTGAEAALVVNNNAAAVYLVLDTIVKGKEVIVSRGELVEIGGSFRVPEIMKTSGCQLIEVGTTNKTHPFDYEAQINEGTGALLKVHTSNYKIIGFTEEVTVDRLKEIGVKYHLPVIYDLGSGLFTDLRPYGINDQPTVKRCLKQGADLVCFSGDKLLGGPQAGIIVGKADYIRQMKKNHLLRALRIDKLTLAALELTLRQYLSPDQAIEQIPTLKMIASTPQHLKGKAAVFYALLNQREGRKYRIIAVESQIGGGSMPGVSLPSYAIAAEVSGFTPDRLEQRMRESAVPIIARITKDQVVLDVRTMEQDEIEIAAAFFNEL